MRPIRRDFRRIPGGWRFAASSEHLGIMVLRHSDATGTPPNGHAWKRCKAPGQDGATFVFPRLTIRFLIARGR